MVCRRNASTAVDHIVPKAQGGQDTDDNLQGICGDCHSEKTAKESAAARKV
jgi:5-methylcytosine-specific restriction protein A